jgi:hypothetical protein
VSTQAVSKWECGLALPDVNILLELSWLFEISINSLLEGGDKFTNANVMIRSKLPENIESILKSKNELTAQQSTPRGTYGINTILNEIMFIIPENTEITRLATKQKNITMDIQSKDYSQIGFFIATLRNQNLLRNIQIVNTEFKDVTKFTITGDLP